jgi:Tol biopolymer transport system component
MTVGIALAAVEASAQDAITRVSVDSSGGEGDDASWFDTPPALSADGRSVAFSSLATNLVANDANGVEDVFVHDRVSGATVRVSIDSSGVEGDGASKWPSLSGDGRYVAFQSAASNFVAGDFNGTNDVFVHDRDPDGNGVFDEGNGVTTFVSVTKNGAVPHRGSFSPSISADGRFVTFGSAASTLVSGDLNGFNDVFLRDLAAATTTLVSVDSGGVQGNGDSAPCGISKDGAFVAFTSMARNLVPGDTNGNTDIFVRDVLQQTTERVSVDSSGREGKYGAYQEANGISADGRWVVFTSYSSNLVASDTNGVDDVFVHDRSNGTTERVDVSASGAQADGASSVAAISGDGRFVSFSSSATNLTPHRMDGNAYVFLLDRTSSKTVVVSARCGSLSDNISAWSPLSADGGILAFKSFADDLVSNDTNGVSDVFAFDGAVDAAAWNNYGAGFPGTLGVPGLAASDVPELGSTITIDVGNSLGSWTVGFLAIGFGAASLPTKFGGTLLVDYDFLVPLALPPSGLSVSADVPYDPSYALLSAYLQAFDMDAGAAHGLSFTPGLHLLLGR